MPRQRTGRFGPRPCGGAISFADAILSRVLRPMSSAPVLPPAALARYSRQIMLAGIGEEGQRKLAAARVLVGLHGSAFTNMLFCAPGALVIEIFLEPGFPWYARLAQACGHRHVAIRAESDGSGAEALAAEIRRQLTAYPS